MNFVSASPIQLAISIKIADTLLTWTENYVILGVSPSDGSKSTNIAEWAKTRRSQATSLKVPFHSLSFSLSLFTNSHSQISSYIYRTFRVFYVSNCARIRIRLLPRKPVLSNSASKVGNQTPQLFDQNFLIICMITDSIKSLLSIWVTGIVYIID